MTRETKSKLISREILGDKGIGLESSSYCFSSFTALPFCTRIPPIDRSVRSWHTLYTFTTLYSYLYIHITTTRIVGRHPIALLSTIDPLVFFSMGQTLSEPIVDKKSSRDNNDRFAYGASAMQGWRLSILFISDYHKVIVAPGHNNLPYWFSWLGRQMRISHHHCYINWS